MAANRPEEDDDIFDLAAVMAETGSEDDDIFDLTDVVNQGAASGPTPGPDAPPAVGGGSGADFGADLDALLDSLTGDTLAPTEPAPGQPVAPPPSAAPIKDPTPADHPVDPHETIPEAESSDIDSLLAELGIAESDSPAPKPAAAAVSPQESRDSAAKPRPVLDDLPEDLAAVMAPLPHPASDGSEVGLKAAAARAPIAMEELPDLSMPPAAASRAGDAGAAPAAFEAPAASAPAFPEDIAAASPVAPGAPRSSGTEAENIDLHGLDALLDTMLSSAPASGHGSGADAESEHREPLARAGGLDAGGGGRQPALEAAAVPLPAAAQVGTVGTSPAPVAAPPFDPSVLEGRLEVLDEALKAVRENVTAVQGNVGAIQENIRAVQENVAEVQENLKGVQENVTAASQRFVPSETLEKRVEALLAPGSPLLAGITSAVLGALVEEIHNASGGAGNESLQAALEKMTAAAAAKIIREELVNLTEN